MSEEIVARWQTRRRSVLHRRNTGEDDTHCGSVVKSVAGVVADVAVPPPQDWKQSKMLRDLSEAIWLPTYRLSRGKFKGKGEPGERMFRLPLPGTLNIVGNWAAGIFILGGSLGPAILPPCLKLVSVVHLGYSDLMGVDPNL